MGLTPSKWQRVRMDEGEGSIKDEIYEVRAWKLVCGKYPKFFRKTFLLLPNGQLPVVRTRE
jgi:hypothetical protein